MRLPMGCVTAAATLPAVMLAVAGLADGAPKQPHFAYHARADVDGDGQLDRISVTRGHDRGRLQVMLATGRRLEITLKSDAPFLPALVAVGNVNGTPGAELFVDVEHITTEEVVMIYTYAGGSLRQAGRLMAWGGDAGIRFGINCSRAGANYLVTQHEFEYRFQAPHYWTRQDITYVWHGSALQRAARGPARRIAGPPPSSQVGLHC